MSTDDLCLILESSAKSGVTELKFGDLHVKFGRPAENEVGPETVIRVPYPFMPQNPASAPVKDLTEEQHEKQSRASLEKDEIELREEQLARALVEDPVLYEEMLRDGELSNELDGADDADDIADAG